MAARSIFFSVGSELEEFTDGLKDLDHKIHVLFHTKLKSYSCKLVVLTKDKQTDQIFFHCLVKIRSWDDIGPLKVLLEGMQASIEKFCKKNPKEDE